MISAMTVLRHIWYRCFFALGVMAWLCSAYVGRSWIESSWELPRYRISLYGLPLANQMSAQDSIRLPSNALLEILIQPLAQVHGQVHIAPYFITEAHQLQRWPIELVSYDTDAFILRAQTSCLPRLTVPQNRLIFVAYRSRFQGIIIRGLIENLPRKTALLLTTWLQGRLLYANIDIIQ